MSIAGIDHQRGLAITAGAQDIGNFLYRPDRAAGLQILCAHGGGHIQQDNQRVLIFLYWLWQFFPGRAGQRQSRQDRRQNQQRAGAGRALLFAGLLLIEQKRQQLRINHPLPLSGADPATTEQQQGGQCR